MTANENDHFYFYFCFYFIFFVFAMSYLEAACRIRHRMAACPKDTPLYLGGEPGGWEATKNFFQIVRPARVHKSECDPLIESSQLQHITAQPGSLMHA